MKPTKKIKSFTLSELLVVLVISSIVISITFLVLLMVQKQIKNIQTNLITIQEIQDTERMIWKDFNEYNLVYYEKQKGLIFKSELDSLIYKFDDNFIIRKNYKFPIHIVEKKLFLNGKEVQSGTIDAIKIDVIPVFGITELFIYKNKDASFYLNN